MKIRKVKRFLAGLVLDAAGVIMLAMGCIGAYMTGGTRLLFTDSQWGSRWLYYPWFLLAGAVLLAAGIILTKIGFLPASGRKSRPGNPAVPPGKSPALPGAGKMRPPGPAPSAARPARGVSVKNAAPSSNSGRRGRFGCSACRGPSRTSGRVFRISGNVCGKPKNAVTFFVTYCGRARRMLY